MASNSNLKIRDVRADDAGAIIEIFRSSVRNIARRDYTQEQVLAWAPDEIDIAGWEGYATRRAFIAEDEKGPAGFADLEDDGHVEMMYVHPRYQGKGVASALLSHLESVARSLGVQELYTEASITARLFFERRGFQLVEQQLVSTRGQNFINFRMKKLLLNT
jgi:GNAT superfamily N-acetyltransferase